MNKLIFLIKSDFCKLTANSSSKKIKLMLHPSFRATLLIRCATYQAKFFLIIRLISKLILKNFYNIELNSHCKIDAGLFLPHPRDIIIGAIYIGTNCTIMHGVTLGSDKVDFTIDSSTRPKIGNDCFLGINSVVLGAGKLQNGTIVRPNSFLRLKNNGK